LGKDRPKAWMLPKEMKKIRLNQLLLNRCLKFALIKDSIACDSAVNAIDD
jgi:hypothetical protein